MISLKMKNVKKKEHPQLIREYSSNSLFRISLFETLRYHLKLFLDPKELHTNAFLRISSKMITVEIKIVQKNLRTKCARSKTKRLCICLSNLREDSSHSSIFRISLFETLRYHLRMFSDSKKPHSDVFLN